MGTTDATIVQLWKPSPEGCDECGHNGFKGRVGIYEVLGISVAIQKMITANATSNDIQEQAISEGMITMQMDGLIKSFRGVTTIEEILRATREQ
jgi:type II secretion system protein E